METGLLIYSKDKYEPGDTPVTRNRRRLDLPEGMTPTEAYQILRDRAALINAARIPYTLPKDVPAIGVLGEGATNNSAAVVASGLSAIGIDPLQFLPEGISLAELPGLENNLLGQLSYHLGDDPRQLLPLLSAHDQLPAELIGQLVHVVKRDLTVLGQDVAGLSDDLNRLAELRARVEGMLRNLNSAQTMEVADGVQMSLQRAFYTGSTGGPLTGVIQTSYTFTNAEGVSETRVIASVSSFDKAKIDLDGSGLTTVTLETAEDELGNRIDESVKIKLNNTTVSAGQIGSIFGSTIGRQLADDALGSIALSTILGAVGRNLFEIIDFTVLNSQRLDDAIDIALADFGVDLEGAAKGAVSSFLVGELLSQIGLEGIAGEVLQTTAGSTLSSIANNFLSEQAWNANLGPVDFYNVLGGFVGAKLASEVVNFDTLGGQIGASVGGAAGAYAAGKLLGDTLGNFLAPGLGAFAGFIVGGVAGSLFGGTPRSGADVTFDPATGEFGVTNVWARKGGSKEAAEGLATAAAEALNGVLGLIGGAVVTQGRVSGGSYGLRKSDYTYRVDGGAFGPGDPGKRTIARTFDGDEEDAAAQLIEHGVLNALEGVRIAGGDVYLKRALYTSLDSLLAGDDVPAGLEGEALGALYGNLATAGDYKTYVENAAANNNLPETRHQAEEAAA